jgi:putative MATE family efflux protein
LSNIQENNVVQKGLVGLTIPIFIELLFTYMITFTDVFFLNHVSQASAAAVGTLMPIIVIPIVILHSLAIGTMGVIGVDLGSKNISGIENKYFYTLIFNLVFGLLIMFSYLLGHSYIGPLMGMDANMSELAAAFLLFFCPSFLIKAIHISYGSILNINGWTKQNMYATVSSNIINIALNYFFLIGVFDLGLKPIENVALSSTISYLFGLFFVAYATHAIKIIKFNCHFESKSFYYFMRRSFKIGGPATVEPLSYELNRFFITILIVSMGTIALTTRIYTLNLILLAVVFSQAVGVGNRIIASHYIGAKKIVELEKQVANSCIFSVVISSAILIFTWCFSTAAFSIFTHDENIVSLGVKLLLIDLLRHPAGAINMVIVNTLVVSGDAKYPVSLSVASMWLICLPLVYFFAVYLDFGLIGVWLALLVDEYLRCAMNIIRWRTGQWQHHARELTLAV